MELFEKFEVGGDTFKNFGMEVFFFLDCISLDFAPHCVKLQRTLERLTLLTEKWL